MTQTTWIENLAIEEMNMEESGFINYQENFSANQVLEESSIEFVNKLKDRFEFYIALFNQYRVNRDQGRMIKIFRISNTINDFMLFRNTLKLIVARRSADVISVGFLTNHGGLLTPKIAIDSPQSNSPVQEIKAHVGSFNQVSWRFQGEPVDPETLVRYYLSEFIRHSAR